MLQANVRNYYMQFTEGPDGDGPPRGMDPHQPDMMHMRNDMPPRDMPPRMGMGMGPPGMGMGMGPPGMGMGPGGMRPPFMGGPGMGPPRGEQTAAAASAAAAAVAATVQQGNDSSTPPAACIVQPCPSCSSWHPVAHDRVHRN